MEKGKRNGGKREWGKRERGKRKGKEKLGKKKSESFMKKDDGLKGQNNPFDKTLTLSSVKKYSPKTPTWLEEIINLFQTTI